MAFCGKCGAQMEEGAKFCPSCGEGVAAPQETVQQPQQPQQNDIGAKVAALNNTADTTADFDPQDIANNKVMGVLSYLGILCLIPIFAAKDSKFARFHANQGLILCIANIAWSIVSRIVGSILTAISWRLGFISTILSLLSLVFLILAIIGIVNVVNGKAKELPIIGKYKLLK